MCGQKSECHPTLEQMVGSCVCKSAYIVTPEAKARHTEGKSAAQRLCHRGIVRGTVTAPMHGEFLSACGCASCKYYRISLALALLKKLEPDREVISSPGVFVSRKSFEQLMDELSGECRFIYLRENGEDVREYEFPENPCYILGDDRDPTEEEEAIMAKYPYDTICLGPVSLHANHCMILVHNEMDRRKAGE